MKQQALYLAGAVLPLIGRKRRCQAVKDMFAAARASSELQAWSRMAVRE